MDTKILIIDDDSEDRFFLREKLKYAGYWNVIEAKDGEKGLEMTNIEKPEVVLLDTILPKLDGFEVCKEIKRQMAPTPPKVIIFTGVLDAVNAQKAKQVQADDYCVKTVDFAYVISTLNKLIG